MLVWFGAIATMIMIVFTAIYNVADDPMTMDRQPSDGSPQAYVALQYLAKRQALAERKCNPSCPDGYVEIENMDPVPGSLSDYLFDTISTNGQVFTYINEANGTPIANPLLSIAQKASPTVKSTIGLYETGKITYKTILTIRGENGEAHTLPTTIYENVVGMEAMPSGSVFIGSTRWSNKMNSSGNNNP